MRRTWRDVGPWRAAVVAALGVLLQSAPAWIVAVAGAVIGALTGAWVVLQAFVPADAPRIDRGGTVLGCLTTIAMPSAGRVTPTTRRS